MENNEEEMGMIYGLISPVTYKVRYIGQSTRSLQVRLNEHWSHALNGRYVGGKEIAWMRALKDEGLRPGIVCLEEVSITLLDLREMFWIAEGLRLGWKLLNEDAGGKGRRALSKVPLPHPVLQS